MLTSWHWSPRCEDFSVRGRRRRSRKIEPQLSRLRSEARVEIDGGVKIGCAPLRHRARTHAGTTMTDQSDDEAELAAALALSMGGSAAPPGAATDDQGALQVMEICGCTLQAANAAIAAAQGSVDLAVELILGGGDEPAEEYKMTALVRTDLGMGVGKIAAQVSHATLGAYRDACTSNSDAVRAWSSAASPPSCCKCRASPSSTRYSRPRAHAVSSRTPSPTPAAPRWRPARRPSAASGRAAERGGRGVPTPQLVINSSLQTL